MEQPEQEKLLFHSFMHSQGSYPLQRLVFQYVMDHTGIDLVDTAANCDRTVYEHYTGSSNSHVNITHPKDPEFAKRSIRDVFIDLNGIRPKKGYNSTGLAQSIARTIIKTDIYYTKQATSKNAEPRIISRLAGPRPSFMLYHGRDRVTTKIPLFDQMYKDAWATQPPRSDRRMSRLVNRKLRQLSRQVINAES